MDVYLGIDAGISTAKLVLTDSEGSETAALQIAAPEKLSDLQCAAADLTRSAGIEPEQLRGIAATGVGAPKLGERLFGVPVRNVDELTAVGRGGLLLTGLPAAVVMSMGTGTAFVYASGDRCTHQGGTGVGGGTLTGLGARLLGTDRAEEIAALALTGNLEKVDLTVGSVGGPEVGMLSAEVTASNFGKNSPEAERSDLALGLMNMVFQTAGVMAAFVCRSTGVHTVAAVGSPTALPQARQLLDRVGGLFSVDFVIPAGSRFAAALGAVYTIAKK